MGAWHFLNPPEDNRSHSAGPLPHRLPQEESAEEGQQADSSLSLLSCYLWGWGSSHTASWTMDTIEVPGGVGLWWLLL